MRKSRQIPTSVGTPPFTEAARRLPVVSLLLVGICILVQTSAGSLEILEYRRESVLDGEVWRLLTGHFTHWSWNHLFWDALSLGILACICERKWRRKCIECISISAITISTYLVSFRPGINLYRGLSGIDSALFVLVVTDFVINKYLLSDRSLAAMGGLLLFFFMGKTIYELTTGNLLFVEADNIMVPIPEVHIVGAGVGFVLGLLPCVPRIPGCLTQNRRMCPTERVR